MALDYGIRWEPACIADVEQIFGNLEAADHAMHAVEWQLSHDPFRGTWEIVEGSGFYLTRTRAHHGFPPVAYSFRVVTSPPPSCYCLMLRARLANRIASPFSAS